MFARSILSVPIRKLAAGATTEDQDLVAVEEPLQIRIGLRNVAITMRTPGQDAELAAGFLFTEGIVQPGEIESIGCTRNTAVVTLAGGAELDSSRIERNFYVSSSCGVCGKTSIEAIESAGCTTLRRDVPQSRQPCSVPCRPNFAMRSAFSIEPVVCTPAGCSRLREIFARPGRRRPPQRRG